MTSRVDQDGAAYAGSQLQTQLYVNRRTDQLDAALRGTFADLSAATFQWRSPVAEKKYAEYHDRSFLTALGLQAHADALMDFWPTGGSRWDALATVDLGDGGSPAVVLGEGKSYPAELYGSGCQAKPGSESRRIIERSLNWTKTQLGIAAASTTRLASGSTPHGSTPDMTSKLTGDATDVTGTPAADWTGPLYQSANRLAHQQWLRSRGVRTWLVHLLFTGDPIRPTSDADWEAAMAKADQELGLNGPVKGVGHVLLPAGTREDLVG